MDHDRSHKCAVILGISTVAFENRKSQITNRKSQIENHKSQIENHKSKITNRKSQIENHKSQITNHKSQIRNWICITWESIDTPRSSKLTDNTIGISIYYYEFSSLTCINYSQPFRDKLCKRDVFRRDVNH